MDRLRHGPVIFPSGSGAYPLSDRQRGGPPSPVPAGRKPSGPYRDPRSPSASQRFWRLVLSKKSAESPCQSGGRPARLLRLTRNFGGRGWSPTSAKKPVHLAVADLEPKPDSPRLSARAWERFAVGPENDPLGGSAKKNWRAAPEKVGRSKREVFLGIGPRPARRASRLRRQARIFGPSRNAGVG